VTAFTHTSPHFLKEPFFSARRTIKLPCHTADPRVIIHAAMQCIETTWQPGHRYIKSGVELADFAPAEEAPRTLFNQQSDRTEKLINTIYGLQDRYGRKIIHFAATGTEQPWKLKAQRRTPRYTTRLPEVPKARA
jgi:DNA polymerase V